MMLYGGGQWGRWAYLWIFISVLIVGLALGLLAENYPKLDFLFATPVILVLFALSMALSYFLVRKYYRLRDRQNLRQ